VPAVCILKGRDVVFDYPTQFHHLDGVSAQLVALLIAELQNNAADRKHRDDEDAGRGAKEKL
jgi:hypothetical protein